MEEINDAHENILDDSPAKVSKETGSIVDSIEESFLFNDPSLDTCVPEIESITPSQSSANDIAEYLNP